MESACLLNVFENVDACPFSDQCFIIYMKGGKDVSRGVSVY